MKKSKPKEKMDFRQSLFWDVDPKTIDPEKHARYIIERVLDFGAPEEVGWVFRRYSKEEIKEVMELPRSQVNQKSKALWSLLLEPISKPIAVQSSVKFEEKRAKTRKMHRGAPTENEPFFTEFDQATTRNGN